MFTYVKDSVFLNLYWVSLSDNMYDMDNTYDIYILKSLTLQFLGGSNYLKFKIQTWQKWTNSSFLIFSKLLGSRYIFCVSYDNILKAVSFSDVVLVIGYLILARSFCKCICFIKYTNKIYFKCDFCIGLQEKSIADFISVLVKKVLEWIHSGYSAIYEVILKNFIKHLIRYISAHQSVRRIRAGSLRVKGQLKEERPTEDTEKVYPESSGAYNQNKAKWSHHRMRTIF